jgi:putative protein-disulfide isomerase
MIELCYFHDPMCSWCWGFRPIWEEITSQLPANIEIKYLLGGLAPDSDEPMPQTMQDDIAGYWRKIQGHIPNTEFNFDFWKQCEPRRSTYPACRAVIATCKQQAKLEREMIKAIQTAYYLKAQNPSNTDTLIQLATDLGLDSMQFTQDLQSQDSQDQLQKEIMFSREIGAQGFPSMIIANANSLEQLNSPQRINSLEQAKSSQPDKKPQLVPLNYNDPKPALAFINSY